MSETYHFSEFRLILPQSGSMISFHLKVKDHRSTIYLLKREIGGQDYNRLILQFDRERFRQAQIKKLRPLYRTQVKIPTK